MKQFFENTTPYGASLGLALIVLVGGVSMSLLTAFGHLA